MMKVILFTVVLVAITTATSGQATSLTPKSDCGVKAQKCYTDSQTEMDNYFKQLKFATACQMYQTIVVCMAAIENDCRADPDYIAVKKLADEDQEGICGVDGKLIACGTDAQNCFLEMNSSMALLLTSDITRACKEIAKFAGCVDNVVKTKECAPNLITRLQKAELYFDEKKLIAGCDGPCAQAIGVCSKDAVTLPQDTSLSNLNLMAYCKSSFKVYNCINGMSDNPACTSGDDKTNLELLKSVSLNLLAQVGDVCNSDGTSAPCVQDLVDCSADLKVLPKDASNDDQCNAASMFLECISKLPCTTALKPVVDNMKQQMETDERKNLCPTVGSCTERFQKCGDNEKVLSTINKDNHWDICSKAQKGLGCFDFVKKDPICINERNVFATDEQSIKAYYYTECAGAFIQSSLVLLALTLLASLKHYI